FKGLDTEAPIAVPVSKITGVANHASMLASPPSFVPSHLRHAPFESKKELPIPCHRFDLEPDGIQSWQEHEGENRPAEGTPDQGVCQRSPENRLGERSELQHGGERRQNDRTGALHGGLDHRVEWRQSILLVLADLVDQDERVAHQDSGKRDQSDQRVDAKWLPE